MKRRTFQQAKLTPPYGRRRELARCPHFYGYFALCLIKDSLMVGTMQKKSHLKLKDAIDGNGDFGGVSVSYRHLLLPPGSAEREA